MDHLFPRWGLRPGHLSRGAFAAVLLALHGGPGGDVPVLDPLPPGDDDDDDDLGTADPGALVPFSAEIQVPGDEGGTVVLEFRPAWEGGEVRVVEAEPGLVEVTDLLPGHYGLRAWLDRDGDGAWDGVWEDGGEPSAMLGLELPRGHLPGQLQACGHKAEGARR